MVQITKGDIQKIRNFGFLLIQVDCLLVDKKATAVNDQKLPNRFKHFSNLR